jgi:putative transposase
MPQSIAQLNIHLVFSTKKRRPFIKPEIEAELHAYIGGTIKNMGGIPLKINGMPDHIHILFSMPRTLALSKIVGDIKRSSSLWIKSKDSSLTSFSWQTGYAAFSVGYSQKDMVVRYIANQKVHHRKKTYEEEVVKFLDDQEMEYDERYFWD